MAEGVRGGRLQERDHRQGPAGDDPDWDAEDARYTTIRWITSTEPSFGAIGPSQTDPRTGEILDADILIEGSEIPGLSNQLRRWVGPETVEEMMGYAPADLAKRGLDGRYACLEGLGMAEEGAFLNTALRLDGLLAAGHAGAQGVHRRRHQGRDHARGRAHARAAPQLQVEHGRHGRAPRRQVVDRGARAHRLDHGLRHAEHRRRPEEPGAVLLADARARTTCGPSSTATRRAAPRTWTTTRRLVESIARQDANPEN